MITKPLLAGTLEDLNQVKYPVMCTPKLDGFRCLKVNGHVVTRTFKDFPNLYVRESLQSLLPDGVDGEVMLQEGSYCDTASQLAREQGEPAFVYHIFDYVKDDLNKPYSERMRDLIYLYNELPAAVRLSYAPIHDKIVSVLPINVCSQEELLALEENYLSLGHEGVMLRRPDGHYKCGRSSVKEGILLKLKRFTDSEARIIGFEEKMHNANPADKDNFGRTKRSSKLENLIPAGTLGALLVEDINSGVQFSIGTGFDDEMRARIWADRNTYLGSQLTYKYQKVGQKDLPRFPVFKGFRPEGI